MRKETDQEQNLVYSEGSLLDEVIRPLLENRITHGDVEFKRSDIEKLRQVAVESHRLQLTLQEFSNAITLEFLKLRLPATVLNEVSLEKMSQLISGTLTNSPLCNSRMVELWEYLLEN